MNLLSPLKYAKTTFLFVNSSIASLFYFITSDPCNFQIFFGEPLLFCEKINIQIYVRRVFSINVYLFFNVGQEFSIQILLIKLVGLEFSIKVSIRVKLILVFSIKLIQYFLLRHVVSIFNKVHQLF